MFHCSVLYRRYSSLKVAVQEITGNNIVYSASLLAYELYTMYLFTITELFLLHDCLV